MPETENGGHSSPSNRSIEHELGGLCRRSLCSAGMSFCPHSPLPHGRLWIWGKAWSSEELVVCAGRAQHPGQCREGSGPRGLACESVVSVTASPVAGVTLGFPSPDLLVFSPVWEERE